MSNLSLFDDFDSASLSEASNQEDTVSVAAPVRQCINGIPVPERIGQTVIGSHIGSGCYGSVFQGKHPVRGDVAVKIFFRYDGKEVDLPATWARRKEEILKEAQRLREAAHRNVVAVWDLEDDTDWVAIVMDHCPDGSLQTMHESGPLPPSLVHKILTDLCLGLAVVHDRGMIHRDIKPSNILIARDGRYVLGDFGWVTSDLYNGYGSPGGYPGHHPPEVFDTNVMTTKSDIWSVGVTAYRLLHGADIWSEVPKPNHYASTPDFFKNLLWLPHVTAEWRRFIGNCLKEKPSQRLQSVAEVINRMSGLPRPSWECQCGESLVRWKMLLKSGRKIEVDWDRSKPAAHHWSAATLPINGSGKRYHLDKGVNKTPRQAERELEAFFTKHRHPGS